jgi:hypothetical protein
MSEMKTDESSSSSEIRPTTLKQRLRFLKFRLFAMSTCNVGEVLRQHVEFATAALEREDKEPIGKQTTAHGDLWAAELIWKEHKSTCPRCSEEFVRQP